MSLARHACYRPTVRSQGKLHDFWGKETFLTTRLAGINAVIVLRCVCFTDPAFFCKLKAAVHLAHLRTPFFQ